jgi:hypothetical protein
MDHSSYLTRSLAAEDKMGERESEAVDGDPVPEAAMLLAQ